MLFHIGLENGDENRSVAWVLGHPGCFAYGSAPEAALSAVPEAVRRYSGWIESHQGMSWISTDDLEVRLEESWQVYSIDESFERVDDGYVVNAWFLDDWKPLSAEDAQRGLALLSWSRLDLEEAVKGLSREMLDREYPNERWSIDGILRHVGGAEWWYLDRLGLAFPRQDVPDDTTGRLVKVRQCLLDALLGLVGSRQVVGVDGEFWSPRKLLRRAVWHERDHVQHIAGLLAQDNSLH